MVSSIPTNNEPVIPVGSPQRESASHLTTTGRTNTIGNATLSRATTTTITGKISRNVSLTKNDRPLQQVDDLPLESDIQTFLQGDTGDSLLEKMREAQALLSRGVISGLESSVIECLARRAEMMEEQGGRLGTIEADLVAQDLRVIREEWEGRRDLNQAQQPVTPRTGRPTPPHKPPVAWPAFGPSEDVHPPMATSSTEELSLCPLHTIDDALPFLDIAVKAKQHLTDNRFAQHPLEKADAERMNALLSTPERAGELATLLQGNRRTMVRTLATHPQLQGQSEKALAAIVDGLIALAVLASATSPDKTRNAFNKLYYLMDRGHIQKRLENLKATAEAQTGKYLAGLEKDNLLHAIEGRIAQCKTSKDRLDRTSFLDFLNKVTSSIMSQDRRFLILEGLDEMLEQQNEMPLSHKQIRGIISELEQMHTRETGAFVKQLRDFIKLNPESSTTSRKPSQYPLLKSPTPPLRAATASDIRIQLAFVRDHMIDNTPRFQRLFIALGSLQDETSDYLNPTQMHDLLVAVKEDTRMQTEVDDESVTYPDGSHPAIRSFDVIRLNEQIHTHEKLLQQHPPSPWIQDDIEVLEALDVSSPARDALLRDLIRSQPDGIPSSILQDWHDILLHEADIHTLSESQWSSSQTGDFILEGSQETMDLRIFKREKTSDSSGKEVSSSGLWGVWSDTDETIGLGNAFLSASKTTLTYRLPIGPLVPLDVKSQLALNDEALQEKFARHVQQVAEKWQKYPPLSQWPTGTSESPSLSSVEFSFRVVRKAIQNLRQELAEKTRRSPETVLRDPFETIPFDARDREGPENILQRLRAQGDLQRVKRP